MKQMLINILYIQSLKNKTGISNVKSERKDPFELNKYKKIIMKIT